IHISSPPDCRITDLLAAYTALFTAQDKPEALALAEDRNKYLEPAIMYLGYGALSGSVALRHLADMLAVLKATAPKDHEGECLCVLCVHVCVCVCVLMCCRDRG